MNSPLPDASTLEAGILEDERPSRLSRVQGNVRNLLRASIFGSVASSPTTPTHRQLANQEGRTESLHSPIRYEVHRGQVLPSPSNSGMLSVHDETVVADPPAAGLQRLQQMNHQSTLFNTRAVAAINHPDLSDPSMESLTLQKTRSRQQHSRKRAKHRRIARKAACSRALLCVLAAVLLAGLVATYVSIATTASGISTTFHVLFILAILLATIVFAHAALRLCLAARSRSRDVPTFVSVSRHGQRRRQHGPRHLQIHPLPKLTTDARGAFMPPTPIQVHVIADDVLADENVAQPTTGADHSSHLWDKEVDTIPNPPPAYGRWRGSVRADPDLLHWVPSPTSSDREVMPSPTYEEGSPPSYMTRESPARQRELQEARAGIARSVIAEPEMLEVRNGPPLPEVGQAF
ncbi:uncharacterized protein RCC_03400 [Ramularia collo-cygni]|uniref:Transmembrane protein n=1 Tax=Ramularia collo-cygni TaxID=112498 RepID=A0A2D3V214_9PEZI|nr:uncharacterized protein RCC_03400 [Ramularia collo-cygni]CZT17566.1 uncharacterized protein RCC_03400 [Ramularia collo-cygni]